MRVADFTSASQVLSAAPAGLELPTPYTIALWMRLDSAIVATGFGCAVCRPFGAQIQDAYAVYVGGDGGEVIFAVTSSNELEGPVIVVGAWTHVTVTQDGNTSSLYVDGALAGSLQAGASPADAHDVLIGQDIDYQGPAGAFPGALADVRMYGRLLRDEEISALAAAP
jgi:hypothetical protein